MSSAAMVLCVVTLALAVSPATTVQMSLFWFATLLNLVVLVLGPWSVLVPYRRNVRLRHQKHTVHHQQTSHAINSITDPEKRRQAVLAAVAAASASSCKSHTINRPTIANIINQETIYFDHKVDLKAAQQGALGEHQLAPSGLKAPPSAISTHVVNSDAFCPKMINPNIKAKSASSKKDKSSNKGFRSGRPPLLKHAPPTTRMTRVGHSLSTSKRTIASKKTSLNVQSAKPERKPSKKLRVEPAVKHPSNKQTETSRKKKK